MRQAIKAGVSYFVAVFGLGFVLGTVRVLFLEPNVGRLPATLMELPVMLLASWHICRLLIARFRVPSSLSTRVAMGALAIALLLAAETLLGVWGFDRTLGQQLSQYREVGPMAGLIAQILFAAFPALQAQPISGSKS